MTKLTDLITNSQLKLEAEQMIEKADLPRLLQGYQAWFVGGSYAYDLLCWRDLDVYVLDPQHNLQRCFEIGYELTRRLSAKKARFSNNVGDEPNGLYWGIKLGDERQGAWKLDVWFLDSAGYKQHANYCAVMSERLTAELRCAILEIKEAYWRRPEYRDSVTSDLIYRAVLDNGVRTIGDFQSFLESNISSPA